jgi:hypothetical protein
MITDFLYDLATTDWSMDIPDFYQILFRCILILLCFPAVILDILLAPIELIIYFIKIKIKGE